MVFSFMMNCRLIYTAANFLNDTLEYTVITNRYSSKIVSVSHFAHLTFIVFVGYLNNTITKFLKNIAKRIFFTAVNLYRIVIILFGKIIRYKN